MTEYKQKFSTFIIMLTILVYRLDQYCISISESITVWNHFKDKVIMPMSYHVH